jgi:hypothetical protein
VTEAIAYMGAAADHLIPECPAMARSKAAESIPHWKEKIGTVLLGTVDVDGTDLCGWCVRVWKARNR